MKKPSASDKIQRRRGQPVLHGILEATIEELARVGFARLSVEEVASRAGVNKTTVYRRFKTKDQLVHDAIASIVEQITAVPDTGAVRTDLIAFLQRVAAYLQSTRGKAVVRVLFAEGANPVLINLIDSMLPHEQTVIPRAAINRAIARGELPPHTDAKLLLYTMVGAMLHRILLENAPASNAHIEHVVDLVLFGATHGSSHSRDRSR